MIIDQNLLQLYGAETTQFKAHDTIFQEGDTPKRYYQITEGRVKLNHYDEDGKEIIQSILFSGQSVCELLLFITEKYPVNAITLTPCEIITIPKTTSLNYLLIILMYL
ncbi:cyclic nucleotide-binding domain-containing protein [Chryseobacterium tructae]|uniref:cyclic nucleotide-binding domain-containing protein n=1 Tax=Chryseobacterium tructae TaxID=1037380 RepID=UPI0025B39215|nr:cyclic nucleotide-binding domain-containing protein [Chryseobacterium tructae]MDN3694308.1 cyclic nucleotide-binding domain-containing protein [Chryseobacterium tructae]